MKTLNELGKAFEAMKETMSNATDAFQAGSMDMEEWNAIYDAHVKKMAGWRRSVLCTLASICGDTYANIAAANRRRDNVDLWSIFCREVRYC